MKRNCYSLNRREGDVGYARVSTTGDPLHGAKLAAAARSFVARQSLVAPGTVEQ